MEQNYITDKTKKFKKAKAKVIALLLTAGTVLTFAGCFANTKSTDNETEIKDSAYVVQNDEQEVTNAKKIKGNLKMQNWKGESYLTIDEESLLEIIKEAMNDAQNLYSSVGAYNMKLDKKGNIISGKENFYPDWMNEYYFLAKAKRETAIYMVNFKSAKTEGQEQSIGVMAITQNALKSTLNDYFKNTFNTPYNFNNVDVFPSYEDVANFKDNDCKQNILQSVYNNVYLSVCYDIYQAKCLGPNHTDYYAPYGGYKEEIRKDILTASYLNGFGNVLPEVMAGKFYSSDGYGKSKYVTDINKFQGEFEQQKNEQCQMQ